MNKNLTSDIQQKARELARQITVAHDLDPDIQEELYGHIEDKPSARLLNSRDPDTSSALDAAGSGSKPFHETLCGIFPYSVVE